MIDRLCDTTASHDRCSVVEVMGRHAGYIALNAGISCSASYIIIPEHPFNKKDLFDRIKHAMNRGKNHFIYEKVLFDSNKIGIFSLLASIPGVLIILGIIYFIFIQISKKIEILKNKE